MNVKFHKITSYTLNFQNNILPVFSYNSCEIWHSHFFLVLLQMTNYIFSP